MGRKFGFQVYIFRYRCSQESASTATLCIYGLMGYRHAAVCLAVRLRICEMPTYVQMHRDDPEPSTSGHMDRILSRLLNRMEERLIVA
jgi:hypothetical protein